MQRNHVSIHKNTWIWLTVAATLLVIVLPATTARAAPLVTEDLSGPLTAEDLAQQLAGAGVTISNVTYTGVDRAAGRFSGGTGIIGFEQGVILSSGDIANVIGPNDQDNVTGSNGAAGDPDLNQLSGFNTLDAAVLEFDFVPNNTQLSFNYVFASDEYNEFVNSSFNDVFAFFVNGTNCARVNGDPVSINTINNGNPYNTDPRSHPALFRNNDLTDGGGTIDTEMDGLTVVLLCQATVTPNVANHMKLAIADASDSILDSNVFLQAGSITTDLSAPLCRVTAQRAGPPAEIDVTVQDPAPGSGLASVQVVLAQNADVVVPPFTAGTTDPVVVTATKISQTQQSRIGLRVSDVQGRATRCTSAGVIVF